MVATIPVNSSMNALEARLSNFDSDTAEENGTDFFDDLDGEQELDFNHE